MQQIKRIAIMFALLVIGCTPVVNRDEPTPTPDPQAFRTPQPTVESGSDIEVTNWRYLPPWENEDEIWVNPNEAVVFRAKHYEGRVVWRDNGFDLSWGNLFCSTAPTLRINNDATVELWPGELMREDCEAAEALHKFSIDFHS